MKRTAHTIAIAIAVLFLCGVACSPPDRWSLGILSSVSDTGVDAEGSCSLSSLMRFTALLDVSSYDHLSNGRVTLRVMLPHPSLTQRA